MIFPELAEHRTYLADVARLTMYRRAIEQLVKPGMAVLDLGSGTGILGMMAARAGARRVYAVEQGPIIATARAVARDNNFDGVIVHVAGSHESIELPEPVDVVVADQLGGFGYDAGLFTLHSQALRSLHSDGTMIPTQIELMISLAEVPDHYAAIDFWRSSPSGFDMSRFRSHAVNLPCGIHLNSANLLSMADIVECRATSDAGMISVRARLVAVRSGQAHGLTGMFRASLAPGVTISNVPDADDKINRWQLFFPFESPVPLAAGETVDVELSVNPLTYFAKWNASCGGWACRQTTFLGQFLSKLTR